jgi:hypothetical protein
MTRQDPFDAMLTLEPTRFVSVKTNNFDFTHASTSYLHFSVVVAKTELDREGPLLLCTHVAKIQRLECWSGRGRPGVGAFLRLSQKGEHSLITV